MLKQLGLGENDERVYWSLLMDPDLGVADLAREVALTEDEVRLALEHLGELTLLRTSRDTPGRFRPVSPEYGLRILLAHQEAELEERRQQVAASRASVQQMVEQYSDLRRKNAQLESEQIVGLDAVQARMEEIIHGAETDCRSAVPGGPVSQEVLTAARPLDEALFRRGVRQRVLYQDAVRASPHTVEYGRWMIENGAEVRTFPVLPPRMLIVDGSIALVPSAPDAPALGAVCVRAPGIVSALIVLFEQTWQLATPLTEPDAPTGSGGLSATERALLSMLARGMTDEAAAKRLGVSLRTVRRRMDELMTRLGANSRFEAGLKAGKRGWLE